MIQVPLTDGAFAVVDDADLALVQGFRWTHHKKHYASRWAGKGVALMHRIIMQAPAGLQVDHINGDGLDNRRSNLRLCTHTENVRNRRRRKNTFASRFKGVVRYTQRLKWGAGIKVDGRRIHLGLFVHEIDAAFAYDRAALKYFGEFAHLNFEMLRKGADVGANELVADEH